MLFARGLTADPAAYRPRASPKGLHEESQPAVCQRFADLLVVADEWKDCRHHSLWPSAGPETAITAVPPTFI